MLLLFADAPVIPDTAALMKEVQAHQQKMDEVRENDTFHRVLETQEMDAKGVVRKTTTSEQEVFFVNGRQVARLLKRDGVPLNEAEEKKEQERVRKLTVERSKAPPSFGRGGGVSFIGTVLAVSDVWNPRRIELNGRSTLVFDFKGNNKAESHGMNENVAKKLAGTVWIDEADRQVARLEVEFYDNFHIGGGLLASVQKGTIRKVEQSPIGEGLWMQTALDQHLNARVIAKSVHESNSTRNSDFRRFDVAAAQKIEQTMNRRELLGALARQAACPGIAAQDGSASRFLPAHWPCYTVEPVKGKLLKTTGYNGMAPGPLLRVCRRARLSRSKSSTIPMCPNLCTGTGCILRAPSMAR